MGRVFRSLAIALCLVSFALPGAADTQITVAGSTSLLPLVRAAAATYQQTHSGITISVTGGGSGQGIAQLAAGTIDIGDSDIPAPGHPELHDTKIAVVGFAVVVSPAAGVTSLTLAQVRGIFGGTITNWKDAGGKNLPIVVINRTPSSGTRTLFVRAIMGSTALAPNTGVEDATGSLLQTMAETPGSISYASIAGLGNTTAVTELALDGAAPNDDNITAGKYPFWSYEHMFTNGPPTLEVSRFLAFAQTNRTLIRSFGFIPVLDMSVKADDR